MTLTDLIPPSLMHFYANLKFSQEVPNEIVIEENEVEEFW